MAVDPRRYKTKADLTEVHQKSAPFLKYKEEAAKLEYAEKRGQSYLDTNLGYVLG